MSTYRCERCDATFEHPAVEECETVGGRCEHLERAGWKPVWIRVSSDAPAGEQNQHLFSKGGWVCPACVGKLAPRPIHNRRRARRGDHPR